MKLQLIKKVICTEKVWDTFKCNTILDYHDLYLKTDVMLLTDVFETFINLCIKDYKLDPSYYYHYLVWLGCDDEDDWR